MILRILSISLSCLLLSASVACATSFSGLVVKVTDGDTIQVLLNGKAEKVRLAGIDTPEKKQPFGQAATRYNRSLSAQKIVTVRVETTDHYGRLVGEVFLPDGRSLNRELVRAGYAWWFRKYSDDQTIGELEDEARQARRGLWAEPNPIAPWEWRKELRKGKRPDALLILSGKFPISFL